MRKILILFIIFLVTFLISKDRLFNSDEEGKKVIRSNIPIELPNFPRPSEKTWNIQSIDTMKYSRDAARAKARSEEFLGVIDLQVRNIAEIGATHMAIGTPYDKEFIPMISKWVSAARKNNLKVWFRGNWSEWEGWFDYPKNLSREKHMQKTEKFILENPLLFEDGDIFSACPECENGGSGDPRQTGDVEGFRNFIISEYKLANEAFNKIGKKVSANYYPMNRDVVKLIMDKNTTASLDGIVVVDHYVESPEQYFTDLKSLQESTNGKIVLGEFGAPIPSVHKKMNEMQQAQWINDVLENISNAEGIEGLNYWVNAGGSTAIWDKNGKSFPAVSVLKKYFKSKNIFGIITDEMNNPIGGARVSFLNREVFSQKNGYFEIRFVESFPFEAIISASGFEDKNIKFEDKINQNYIILKSE